MSRPVPRREPRQRRGIGRDALGLPTVQGHLGGLGERLHLKSRCEETLMLLVGVHSVGDHRARRLSRRRVVQLNN